MSRTMRQASADAGGYKQFAQTSVYAASRRFCIGFWGWKPPHACGGTLGPDWSAFDQKEG